MKYLHVFRMMALLAAVTFISTFFHSCQREEITQEEGTASLDFSAVLDHNLSAYETFTLDYDFIFAHVQNSLTGTFELNLGIPNHPEWDFQCINDDYTQNYADDFAMYEITGDNQLIEREMHPITALECYSDQSDKASFMTFALGRMEAMIFEGETEYYLEPVFNYDQNAPQNLYVLYRSSDAVFNGEQVCLEEGPEIRQENTASDANRTAASCRMVEVTYLGDYKFYLKWSSNRWDNASNWKWNRWYYGQKRFWGYNGYLLDWTLKSAYQYSSSNSTPSTASNKTTFVNECSAFYNYSWYNEGDVNMFWTGYNVSGVIGKADGLNRLCADPSQAFAFGEHRSSGTQANNLMAHEIGHSMGMPHDNGSNNFMNQSYSNWNSSMGPYAKTNLDNHLDLFNGCLYWGTCN